MRPTIFHLFIFCLLFSVSANAEDDTIFLKSRIINPSETEEQTVPFRADLPKEIRPEYIVDMGDMEIDFDYQKGNYFVHMEVTLAPGEFKEFVVEIEDIWKINDDELQNVQQETEEFLKQLKGTQHYDRALFLKNSIDSKLTELTGSRSAFPGGGAGGGGLGGAGMGAVNPYERMVAYREMIEILASIKRDLTNARGMVSDISEISSGTIWKIIITIMIALGLLSLVFFLVWFKQVREVVIDPKEEEVKTDDGLRVEAEHRGKEEKKTSVEDIEKMLGEEEGKNT